MPERVMCKVCGTEWTYAGYPHYMGCPNCDASHWEQEYVKHEEICPECMGTGKVMTPKVHEPSFDGCSPADAARISKEILKSDQKRKKGEESILNRNKRRQTSGRDRRGDQMTETEKEAKGTGIGYIYAQRLVIAFLFTLAGASLGLFFVELNNEGDVTMQIGFGIGVAVMMLFGALAILED